ncbi:calcium channel flower [Hydra vulgaris]|uniref:calcium channel flower n=1 Tax=Hydra vulgaris TaxID=6087 RepID=UPI0002B47100|nr:calcium channel flower [Hydra vulgaris]
MTNKPVPKRGNGKRTDYKRLGDNQKEVDNQKDVDFPRAVARIWGLISGISFVSNGWYLLTESSRDSKKCLIAGALMIVFGIFIIFMECVCCMFAAKRKCCNKFDSNFPFWIKGLIYILLTIPVIVLCFGIKTLVSSIMVIFLGIIYIFLTCIVKSKKYERLRALAQQRYNEQQKAVNFSYNTILNLYRHN